MNISSAKALIRSKMKKQLSSLSMELIDEQSKYITQQLIGMPEFVKSKRISLYLSMPDEVSTDELVEHILTNEKECFIPRYSASKMEMVKLKSMDDFKNLPRNKWNIRQPSLKEEREDAFLNGGLDLVITPGLAFTPSGKRLGRGKGYYDRYLNEMKIYRENNKKTLITIGIAFAEQILDDIPSADYDFVLDSVIYQK